MNPPRLKRFLIALAYLSQLGGHASGLSVWLATRHIAFIASGIGFIVTASVQLSHENQTRNIKTIISTKKAIGDVRLSSNALAGSKNADALLLALKNLR